MAEMLFGFQSSLDGSSAVKITWAIWMTELPFGSHKYSLRCAI